MSFLYIYPPQEVLVASSPVQFVSDGVTTSVSIDTVTPLSSTPLPVVTLDDAGNVANPLTNTELRSTPVPISGALTDVELRATPVPVSGPLTDAQLRATPVSVSGSLTNTELRAAPVEQFMMNTLVTAEFDYQSITYVTIGNGIGEIETVVYKLGGAGGATVATLTLAYDVNNKLSTVTRS